MESFFYNGSSLDLVEVEELLLHRYSNIDYIMNLGINEGILLINKALEKRTEEKHFKMWTAQLPLMAMQMLEYVSFDDYELQVTGKNISTMSREDALAKAEEIEKKAQEKRGEK